MFTIINVEKLLLLSFQNVFATKSDSAVNGNKYFYLIYYCTV